MGAVFFLAVSAAIAQASSHSGNSPTRAASIQPSSVGAHQPPPHSRLRQAGIVQVGYKPAEKSVGRASQVFLQPAVLETASLPPDEIISSKHSKGADISPAIVLQ